MTATLTAAPRAEQVGSFLRPAYLLEARQQFRNGAIDAAALRRVEDRAIAEVVRYQEDLGLRVVGDGEFRRTHFHIDFLAQLAGVTEKGGLPIRFQRAGGEIDYAPPVLEITGKVRRTHAIERANVEYLQSVARATVKLTIPSPTMLHFRAGREDISRSAYPNIDEVIVDVAQAYQEEIAELAAVGLRYLQLDDTNLAYLCDPRQRERAAARGHNPDDLPRRYASFINAATRTRPGDMRLGIHLCRGNHRSSWAAEGGYEPVAEVLFNELDVDAYFLEYDDARSGDFAPLRFVPKGKTVVLGLITTKSGELETADSIKRRIDEAAKFCPLEQLALSPQCGFSSTVHGNELTVQQQTAKIKLVVDVARDVWGAS